MAGDESDQDSQGATALHTLSTVAVEHGAAVTDEEPIAGKSKFQDRPSVPLVRLQPAHTRAERPDKECQLNISEKALRSRQGLASNQSEEFPSRGEKRDVDLREHKSAPQAVPNLEKELRESKSAPNLGSHALATIRSLQGGAIPLDRRLRTKIAAAAKRVLEARELKRRASQEGGGQANRPASGKGLGNNATVTDLHSSKIQRTGPTGSTEGAKSHRHQATPSGPPQIPEASTGAAVPRSLPTAAAIAMGEPSPISCPMPAQQMSPSNQTLGEAAVPSSGWSATKFHRPALSPTLHGGALSSGIYRPFTITTGVPRFAQGGASGLGRVNPNPIAPLTPQGSALEQPPSPSSPLQAATTSAASMTLSAGDLQMPPHTQTVD